MNSANYFREAISKLKTVGSVVPSSPKLARAMVRKVDSHLPQIIVELGTGEGAITRSILAKMHADSYLVAFEINELFLTSLRKIKDERLIIINDSALEINKHLKELKLPHADIIISSLPLVMFQKRFSYKIISACHQALKKNGSYIQFHYSNLYKKLYERIFESVEVSFVLNNLPPAFVFECIRK
ncbi:MAG: methyltransferase [Chitinophagales bacterium]|nr:methyltransferase [Chitinophagales bacterium]